MNSTKLSNEAAYEIIVEGHISKNWQEWFDVTSITYLKDQKTLLKSEIIDQSALFGILKKIRNLGLSLISVNSVK